MVNEVKAMKDPLLDCSPLIDAAASGKLRLVRLLIEGGAQVNWCNPKGETALLAACKALTGEPTGPDTVKLLTYLLHNKANPNAQDRAGRTALMYACMQRAGVQVASTLLSAGADPSMADRSGASALVYAINAQHQATLQVLVDACRAKGCDIIIIATEVGVNRGPVSRRYLNVPPSPDTSPVSCMSPSDIVLKTGSPNSPEVENIFNFRGTGKRENSSSGSRPPSCEQTPPLRQRVVSEPWLALHNLACLNRMYDDGRRERRRRLLEKDGEHQSPGENEGQEDEESHFHDRGEGDLLRVSQSLLSLTEVSSSQVTFSRLLSKQSLTHGGSLLDTPAQRISVEKLPACPSPQSRLRRNTLPSVTVAPPLLHLPPLFNQLDPQLQVPTQGSLSKSKSMALLPHPPSSSTSRASARASLLPPLPLSSSVSSLERGERSGRSLRRHSVQLDRGEWVNHCDL